MTVGDTITCQAEANPDPSYRWVKLSGGGMDISGAVLTVTAPMVGENVYMCIVENYLDANTINVTVIVNPGRSCIDVDFLLKSVFFVRVEIRFSITNHITLYFILYKSLYCEHNQRHCYCQPR